MLACKTLQDYYRAYKRIAEIQAGVCVCVPVIIFQNL